MSTQEVNIRCIAKGYHLCRFEVNVGEVFTANKERGENVETRLKLLTIVDSSASYSPSLWILSPLSGVVDSVKIKCVNN